MLPKPFLRDVQRYRGSFYWINYGLDQLDAAFLTALGMSYHRLETEPGYTSVRYHGVTLEKGDPATNIIRVTAPERCHILAQALNAKGAGVPYMLRSGHFWYVVDSPLSYADDHNRYYAFADTLYDFFGVQPKAQKRAFVRVEDINVNDDQAALRDIADRLHRLHIPFMMAVIPRFQDLTSPEMDHTGIALAGKAGFAATLHYMTDHGGSVIMHGWNHRYRGVSAVDAEFWDYTATGRSAIRPDDSASLVESHLRNGLKDCFAAHIYPIAWETPHYAASMLDYSVLARHFSTAVEQRELLNNEDFGQFFPFVIRRDIYGQQIFPENLGYVEEQTSNGKKTWPKSGKRSMPSCVPRKICACCAM